MAEGLRWLKDAGFVYDPRTTSWMPKGLPVFWVREDDVEWVVCGGRVSAPLMWLRARVAREARRMQRDHEATAAIAAAIAERGEACKSE
jgi:hypothetical protein